MSYCSISMIVTVFYMPFLTFEVVVKLEILMELRNIFFHDAGIKLL